VLHASYLQENKRIDWEGAIEDSIPVSTQLWLQGLERPSVETPTWQAPDASALSACRGMASAFIHPNFLALRLASPLMPPSPVPPPAPSHTHLAMAHGPHLIIILASLLCTLPPLTEVTPAS
jgi:hypothetical protein